jgi:hypothetical protein
LASANQAANSRNGSSASVKSPLLNLLGCSIGAVSDIVEGFLVTGHHPDPARRVTYRGSGYIACAKSLLRHSFPLPRRQGHSCSSPAKGGWASVIRELLNPAARAASIAAVASLAAACGMSAKFGIPDRSSRTESLNLAQNTLAFSSADLIVASAATSRLLDHEGASGPWENPLTGARGTIAPIAAAYRDNGIECRDFLASYVRETAEAWMQGEACRKGSRWEVRSLKPWGR